MFGAAPTSEISHQAHSHAVKCHRSFLKTHRLLRLQQHFFPKSRNMACDHSILGFSTPTACREVEYQAVNMGTEWSTVFPFLVLIESWLGNLLQHLSQIREKSSQRLSRRQRAISWLHSTQLREVGILWPILHLGFIVSCISVDYMG